MGFHALLQGIFPTQGSNPHLLCLLHLQAGFSLPPGTTGEASVQANGMSLSKYWLDDCVVKINQKDHLFGNIIQCSVIANTFLIINLWHLVVLVVKNPPANAGDSRDVHSIYGSGRLLEEVKATHPSILARKILWTEEPVRLQSTALQSDMTEQTCAV